MEIPRFAFGQFAGHLKAYSKPSLQTEQQTTKL